MRDARAVLPAFALAVYYTDKASSSVAAALICGTPLLADEQLLAAYSYVPANATFPKACFQVCVDVLSFFIHACMHMRALLAAYSALPANATLP